MEKFIRIYKPILLFQFKNQNRMSWIDRHGTEHPLTVIGNNNCDARKPFLVTDSGEITDEEKLPIFGVAYGPLTHEAENMTISIGPLVCEPAVADQESDINERVVELELQINETIIELKKGINDHIEALNVSLFWVTYIHNKWLMFHYGSILSDQFSTVRFELLSFTIL
jgi:hypothetical protein